MLYTSPLISSGSGSVAGLTFSHNRGGQYIRARSTPANPQTGRQQDVRSYLSMLSNGWNSLTPGQREGWTLYGQNVPLLNAMSEPKISSGINHYLRSNVPRLTGGLAVIQDAPTEFNLGDTPLTVTFAAYDDNTLDVNGTVTNGPANILLSLSRPVNIGRTPAHEPTRQFAAPLSVAGAWDVTLDASPYPLALGQSLRVYARATRPDGRLSAWDSADAVVGAAP